MKTFGQHLIDQPQVSKLDKHLDQLAEAFPVLLAETFPTLELKTDYTDSHNSPLAEDVELQELDVANKAALQKYIAGLKTGKMRGSTIVKYSDSGKTSTVGKEVPDAATDDDEKDKKKPEPKKIEPGVPGQKDKSLKDVNTSKSEIYKTPDTGVSDKEFNEKEIGSPYENKEDELQESVLDDAFKSGKIPKKYQKVITRLMNSTDSGQSITDYMSGVGAGKLSSQAGEILTMTSLAMSDDEFDGFMSTLAEQTEKYPKKSKPIVTKEWLDSVKAVRSTTNKRYDSEFGEGNWSISNTAWDVPGEFEALGNDDYKKNKGFSSDMYVKLEVKGKPVLDEISLKKDSKANIYNGTVSEIDQWAKGKVPARADIKEYKKGELKRVTDYGSKAKPLKYKSSDLTNISPSKNRELNTTLKAVGIISGTEGNYKVDPKAQEILDKLSKIKPPITRETLKEVGLKGGNTSRLKKYMIMHAAAQRANEVANGVKGDSESRKFLNQHLGYDKGEDGKFPEGSIKRYENDTIDFIVENEEAKEGCLDALAEKLPMKSLFEGEEKMAIGGLSADPKTLKRIFGIDNYKDFKAGLTMKEDDEGKNYLVYESKEPAKNVKISEVQCRQKGQGYASSVGLEFEIAKDFGQKLYKANKEEYPPRPDISDKERKNLGIKEERMMEFNEWIS
jgi:hypothetical protein